MLKRNLIADVRQVSVPSPHFEASLPSLGLTAIGLTREQAVSRLGVSLSMLFDEVNR